MLRTVLWIVIALDLATVVALATEAVIFTIRRKLAAARRRKAFDVLITHLNLHATSRQVREGLYVYKIVIGSEEGPTASVSFDPPCRAKIEQNSYYRQ